MSPAVFTTHGFRFFFYSDEEDRMHVHVEKGEAEAKFWLEPTIELASAYDCKPKTLKAMLRIVEERQNDIKHAWREHFG